MNKLFKKVSAIVLAGAMTLSSSVAAFAADLTVYIRESNGNTKTITKDAFKAFEVENVDATDTLLDALKDGNIKDGVLTTTWNNDKYLKDLTLTKNGKVVYQGLDKGKYSDLVPDGNGGYSSGKWEGNSWMWAPATLKNVVSYPEDKTLEDVTCAEANYAIVLSYEYSSFTWQNVEQ